MSILCFTKKSFIEKEARVIKHVQDILFALVIKTTDVIFQRGLLKFFGWKGGDKK